VLLVNLFGLFCCVQVEYPVYWTYSEWTEGFKRLLDFLHLDEVSTEPNINPFAPRDFAEKRVLKLVEWFSGHCHAIKS